MADQDDKVALAGQIIYFTSEQKETHNVVFGQYSPSTVPNFVEGRRKIPQLKNLTPN
ncbi:MAG: hypothetical protein OHK0036_15560 [Bacteroidia bacterium]